jgi:hypothetical protein
MLGPEHGLEIVAQRRATSLRKGDNARLASEARLHTASVMAARPPVSTRRRVLLNWVRRSRVHEQPSAVREVSSGRARAAVADPVRIASRLGLPIELARRLQERGLLAELDLSDRELGERLLHLHMSSAASGSKRVAP